MSLDCVVSAPDGWLFPFLDDELMDGIKAGLAQADAVLLGRNT